MTEHVGRVGDTIRACSREFAIHSISKQPWLRAACLFTHFLQTLCYQHSQCNDVYKESDKMLCL